jgi:tRNA(Ile)-lysidine synthase
MLKQDLPWDRFEAILAVSGGPDSIYLLNLSRQKVRGLLVAHYNHGARGRESEADQRFLTRLCKDWGLSMEVGRARPDAAVIPRIGRKGRVPPRFEEKAREIRYAFLKDLLVRHKAKKILVAHTADDQVETVLMRVLEGAGITGLKGIPRVTEDGIERPLLDTWREDILKYLEKNKIPYRVDKSNFDTRFERNWIRHVLIPLLEKRYGNSVKKRIYALGERFRELDVFIEQTAYKWLDNNNINYAKSHKSGLPPGRDGKEAIPIPRESYAKLPSLLRIRILQVLCFEYVGTAPNERLLASMDKLIVSGKASARLNVGRGAMLRCRYGEAILSPSGKREKTAAGARRPAQKRKGKSGQGPGGKEPARKIRKKTGTPEPAVRMEGPGIYRWDASGPYYDDVPPGSLRAFQWKEQGKIAPGRVRRLAEGERCAAFDKEMVASPLSVRPLRAGDRIRPFGLDADKKVKEILIDRKVPREERWGRPIVCDASGTILWIPGVVRSAHASVTRKTRRAIVLRADIPGEPPDE